MASPEGFTSRGRVVITVSFGPEVDEFFLSVLTSFDHAFFSGPRAGPGLIARHAGFS